MRIVLFGADAALAESLARSGVEVEQGSQAPAGESGATAALAGGLRTAEEVLAGAKPDAVLIGRDGDDALAIALTAVKLEIPTAWLRPAASPADALVGRVADLSLDATADAETVAAALAELAAPKIPAR